MRRYENWATERMIGKENHAVWIRLADDNLGKRPARFIKDENLAQLGRLRAKFDPDGIFRPWMGRPDRGA